MDTKKLVVAIVVGYVVFAGLGFLIHGVWLQPLYQQYADRWRPQADMEQMMWMMWLGDLVFVATFAYIYSRGVETKPWVGQGIRYAVCITFLTTIPFTIGNYVVFNIPTELVSRWIGAGFVQLLVLGLIVAGIYQKK